MVGQIFCFIVDNSASTGRPILVKCAAYLYSDLAADHGLMNHKSKWKVEGGRTSAAALEETAYGFWMNVIFAGEFIAYQKTTIEENIFAVKLAELTRDACRL